ncbi:putative dihydrodipicolinate synthase protein [Phaeoacremonium minimum UCRPA7]|uniref:Putative dihydrodipicolinate synthase protein n=1 Tax=Phaeoacremonium minimum (strain UCR-PA7) TaxID=1286976 RepID=R8BKW1_PHAM7|nr:putative dihydrodipicolinate synthase protein [Phaeoacremonium minimum UCRPA7]EON99924.1 putative dihydrodipicolinate synthase protein [Phaeoacremonium minimum UCRPA7]
MGSLAPVAPRIPPPGVYVPMLAFFTPDTTKIDVTTTQRHAIRLANAGVAGLVVHGSNGEAAHLTHPERTTIIKAVVEAVQKECDRPLPVIAGCGAQSVLETVELCRAAAQAGATQALVLPPGYYAGLLGPESHIQFFHEVADASPIPILIYNFPAAANGVDLNSDTLLTIAKHPNVVGVKLTCGNTGKLARVVAETAKFRQDDFRVFGGSADFILQGAVVGADGTISGLANLSPVACCRIIELFEAGKLAEARALQAEVAAADWLMIRYGFPGVKAAMPMFYGKGEETACTMRKPTRPVSEKAMQEIRAGVEAVIAIESRFLKERK